MLVWWLLSCFWILRHLLSCRHTLLYYLWVMCDVQFYTSIIHMLMWSAGVETVMITVCIAGLLRCWWWLALWLTCCISKVTHRCILLTAIGCYSNWLLLSRVVVLLPSNILNDGCCLIGVGSAWLSCQGCSRLCWSVCASTLLGTILEEAIVCLTLRE